MEYGPSGGTGTVFANSGLNSPLYIVLVQTAAVPEPSSFVLVGIATALGGCSLRWRRRKNLVAGDTSPT
jgi:hypothetical protein